MSRLRAPRAALIACCAWLLAGCGSSGVSEADVIATRVAQDRAVAQTLTAEAPTEAPTEAPAPTDAPTEAPAPTPTEERVAMAVFAPRAGSNGLTGRRIGVIGGDLYDASQNSVAVSQYFAVQVEAADPSPAQAGDDGIAQVIFSVQNPDGVEIYNRPEQNAPYCLFQEDQDGRCRRLPLQPGATWPDGTPIAPGLYYIQIEVRADNPDLSEFWDVSVDIQLP